MSYQGSSVSRSSEPCITIRVGDKCFIRSSTSCPRFSHLTGIVTGGLEMRDYYDDFGELQGQRLAYKVARERRGILRAAEHAGGAMSRPKRHYRQSSPLVARVVRDLYFQGRLKQHEIGRMFGLRQGSVSRIVSGQTWGAR